MTTDISYIFEKICNAGDAQIETAIEIKIDIRNNEVMIIMYEIFQF